MEYMSRGSLKSWIQSQTTDIKLSLLYKILKELAIGMNYLHTLATPILHRDLKTGNVLVKIKIHVLLIFELRNNLQVAMTDFGLSKLAIGKQQSTMYGTPAYAAPEYLNSQRMEERSEKGDVLSYGVIVWELVTRETPWSEFERGEDIALSVIFGERLEIPQNCPVDLQEIMENCWQDGTYDQ